MNTQILKIQMSSMDAREDEETVDSFHFSEALVFDKS